MNNREAILAGVGAANELHDQFDIYEQLKTGTASIDVFSIISQLGIKLLFKPLDGLLGLYIPSESPGILVTTKRDLHVQRFTAAHELGHFVLQHKTVSLDKDVGFVARGRFRDDFQEDAADAFAAEFLVPKWLLVSHMKRQNWSKNQILRSEIVYQLSLRLGLSYEATCWTLRSHGFLSKSQVHRLRTHPPKESKQKILSDLIPESWFPDVWLITSNDDGANLIAGPDDYLVFVLDEHVANGYSWNFSTPADYGELKILRDGRQTANNERFGDPVHRRVVIQGKGVVRVLLQEKQSWDDQSSPINQINLEISLLGKEPEGLSRYMRTAAA